MPRGMGIVLACVLSASTAFGQRDLLSKGHTAAQLQAMLLPVEQWKPFPTDRAAWEAFPREAREGYIRRGEEALKEEWPALKATDFLEFVRTGDRSHYEGLRNQRRGRLQSLVMAEVMEGAGRFVDQIVNGVWATCEETWWGVPAHVGAQKAGRGLPDVNEPVVDLFAAETAAQLAWTTYLVGPQLEKASPFVLPRIRREIDRRIMTPALQRDDFGWMGFPDRAVNNWNPWINSNWLTCTLLLEKDPARRARSVEKTLRSLDNFLNHYPRDGGCDEGPGYWGRAGASLFDCLELMYSATDGRYNVYDNALVQDIGRFIYRVHISGEYFVNFGDASPRGGGSGDLIYRFGRRINDPAMMAFGAWAAQQRQGGQLFQGPAEASSQGQQGRRGGGGGGGGSFRQMSALFNRDEIQKAKGSPPYLRDVYLPDLQVFAARDQGGSAKGLYVAAKGGTNGESHNHNDVGNFVVYRDGLPLLIDVGVGTYTEQTFSTRRYDIWTMQSAYHNLPTINGVQQREGREFAARDLSCRVTGASAQFSQDIARAYPPEAGLASWKRTVRMNRGRNVEIVENYALNRRAGEITLTLMTPCEVTISAPGKLLLRSADGQYGGATIGYDARKLKATTESVALDDQRLSRSWGSDHLTRILLKAEPPPDRDTWTLTVTP